MTSAEDRFVQLARAHRKHTLEGDAAETSNAYARMVAALRELRQTPDEGVAFLRRIAAGEELGVAAWAALYLLPHDEGLATEVLERIASLDRPRLSLSARMTLKEWRAGRLHVD